MADLANTRGIQWKIFWAEFFAVAVLLLIGLSIIIFMFGKGSPMPQIIPTLVYRVFLTGFLFGSTGALIAISPLGRVSGAHLNPVVTLAFFLMKKIDLAKSFSYVLGQFGGAIAGCLPLLAWGSIGRSISFATTTPGAGYTVSEALLGEVITTFSMVYLLGVFLAFRPLRPYTPAIFPIIYSIMNVLESAVSGLSTNPARSLGPAIISGEWTAFWIYLIGPATGSILATFALSFMARRITTSKLYHFDSNEDLLFRKKNRANLLGPARKENIKTEA